MVALSIDQGFAYYAAKGTLYRGCALSLLGQTAELTLWRQGFSALPGTIGRGTMIPLFLALLAETHQQTGQHDEAARLLTDALGSGGA